MDLDTIKTAIDTGLGAIALLYAHRVGRVLEKQDARITALESRRRRGRK
jgi:hypothetical protein